MFSNSRFSLVAYSLCTFILCQSTSYAVGPEPIRLWADGAPGQNGEEPHDVPLIRAYLPDGEASGAAVVVLPGGGYGGLAMDHEGHQIARWWNRNGVAAFVTTYRHGPHYQHPAPLQDAQRAIRYVRAHADKYQIDPNRVGVMGFSAGGHLASTVSNHFDNGDASSSDPIGKQSSRPDFSVLCYPVISLMDPLAHKGSRRNLLGNSPSDEMVKKLSNHLQVTKETPPTFIFHTAEDQAVPVGNAIVYYDALIKNGVNAELHIYQKGRHGVGLAPNDPILKSWPDRLLDWVRLNNFLTDKKRVSIRGNIKFNGQPLSWGLVSFSSTDSRFAPAVATMVSRGNFSLPIEDGPIPGEHSVSVHHMGAFTKAPTIEDARTLTGNHDQTNLRVDIRATGDNNIHFDLDVK